MLIKTPHPLVCQITAQLGCAVPEWFGSGVSLVPQPEMRQREWSFLIRYPLRGMLAGRALIVKIPREPSMESVEEAVAAQHLYAVGMGEYQTLCAIAVAFEQERSVRPLDYWPLWNALVMEEVEAPSLKSLFLRPVMALNRSQEWQPFEEALKASGQWLRHFHEEVGTLRYQPLERAALQQPIGHLLDQLAALSGGTQPRAPLRAALARAMQQVNEEVVPTTMLHGDFNCANILVDRAGTIFVLDPNGDQRGPAYQELARLITDLSTRKEQVLSYGRFARPTRLARCRAAVVRGYFAGNPYDKHLLNLFCAVAVLHKWVENERTLASASGGARGAATLLAPLLRRYFAGVILRFLESA